MLLPTPRAEPSRTSMRCLSNASFRALWIVTALAYPVIPEATAKIWAQMGLGDTRQFPLSDLQWGQLKLGTKLGEVQAVFPRADKGAIERMQHMEEQERSAAAVAVEEERTQAVAPAAAPPLQAVATTDGKISIEDFAKVELRVGQVKVAERVKGADKL